MNDRIVLVPLARLEGLHLAELVDQFIDLLDASADPEESRVEDPGVDRLTPSAYPEDAEAAAEFAANTRADLLDRRIADARSVRAALEPFLPEDGGPIDEDDALAPRDVVIPRRELDAWLRTLTALRLVIASRLGITGEDDHDPEDARFGVYDWLGYRLEGLIEIADDGPDTAERVGEGE